MTIRSAAEENFLISTPFRAGLGPTTLRLVDTRDSFEDDVAGTGSRRFILSSADVQNEWSFPSTYRMFSLCGA